MSWLRGIHKALGTSSRVTQEMKAGGPEVHVHSQLYIKYEASLGYMVLCLKREGRRKGGKMEVLFTADNGQEEA